MLELGARRPRTSRARSASARAALAERRHVENLRSEVHVEAHGLEAGPAGQSRSSAAAYSMGTPNLLARSPVEMCACVLADRCRG